MPRALRITLLLALGTLLAPAALAQAGGTAIAPALLSTFAAATATQTGLSSGRNLGITAGLDLGFQPFRIGPLPSVYPSLEVRGTYPVDKGHVDSQKTFLGGIKLAAPVPRFTRLQPYATALFGRGSIDYGTGYQVQQTPIFYTIYHSNVFDFGGGIDLKLSDHISLKIDAQAQRFSTPVTASHHLYAASANVGLLYRFHFKHSTNEVLH